MKKNFVFVFFFCCFLFLPKSYADPQIITADSVPNISMDFQDANLKDVLKVFSIQSGLNFIASEALQDRTMTIYLDNVPLDKTMDKLFKANNLSYELDKDANIFIVKDWGKLEAETITKVFYLKYATVSSSSIKEEMKNLKSSSTVAAAGGGEGEGGKWKSEDEAGITSVVKKMLSTYGAVIEDFRTNSLIVTDTPVRMEAIAKVITSLDIPAPQVLLEVEMLDVSKNTVDKMGIKFPSSLVQLDMTTTSRATGFPFSSNYNKAFQPQGWTMGREGKTAGGWKVSDWTASHFGPTIFSIINTQLTLDFLRTQTDTKYLARPRILTLNNETAEIKIVTNEAIGIKTTTAAAEGTSTKTEEAERSETGVSLRVTPQINPDTGEITMFIVPTVSEATTGGTFTGSAGQSITFKDPEIRSTKSIVKVKDGETIIIGGLIRHESSQTITKLPILGDIPLIGTLFRHKNKEKDKERELLVFITPRIIKEGMEFAQAKKPTIPAREQSTTSGVKRELAINSGLNSFERKGH